MKKLTKVFCMVVAGALCLGMLAGCGDKNNELPEQEPIQTTDSSPEAEETRKPPPVVTTEPPPTEEPSASPEPEESDDEGSSSTEILKEKSENAEVEKVQEKLKELGYLDKVTGYYGTDTVAAVEAFQKKNDLTEDGMVGPGTKKVLFSDDAKSAD